MDFYEQTGKKVVNDSHVVLFFLVDAREYIFNFQIYNWIPEYYNDTNSLPASMPKDLKDKIAQKGKQNSKEVIKYLQNFYK